MTPATVAGYAFAAWRLGADLNWTGEFFIENGVFSRWQVWLAIGVATQMAARRLNRHVPPQQRA